MDVCYILTFKNSTLGCFFDSSSVTSFICLHGSAQGAQKLVIETLLRSPESNVWKCSTEITSMRFESDILDEGRKLSSGYGNEPMMALFGSGRESGPYMLDFIIIMCII
jgi:hypothetical protein